MKNFEVSIISYEVSPSFDPRFARNGGGYEQPTIEGEISWDGCDEPMEFVIDDTSCGEFGSRYSVSIFGGPAELCGQYSTNGIDFNGELPDESSFKWSEELEELREAFEKATRFWFYTEEELKEDDEDDFEEEGDEEN